MLHWRTKLTFLAVSSALLASMLGMVGGFLPDGLRW